LKKVKRETVEKQKTIYPAKTLRPNLSVVSPRSLAAAGKIEPVAPTISLSALEKAPDGGLVNFYGKSNNHKDAPLIKPIKEIAEKDLEEGEDIVFE